MSTVIDVEWDGQRYEVKYSFKFIQKLKAVGINIGQLLVQVQKDPMGSGAYLDDYAAIACECLRAAGAPVKVERVWRACLEDPEFARACVELFMWLVGQHYASSANAPKNA